MCIMPIVKVDSREAWLSAAEAHIRPAKALRLLASHLDAIVPEYPCLPPLNIGMESTKWCSVSPWHFLA